jgi:acyl phosphate:glycerol-3-phosphate acyltransferase
MTTFLLAVLGIVFGYVSGAIPTGYFVGKLWNVDVRKHGSGRTGGTNVLRTVGWSGFSLTVIGDILKGVVPVLVMRWLFPEEHIAQALAVLGVLLGHNWSIWIAMLAKPDPRATYAAPPMGWIQRIADKGRGGAGVAVTAGAVLALFPPAVLIIAPIAILILVIIRYASVASMTSSALLPFVMLYFVLTGSAPWSYLVLSIIVAVIIILVHTPNIQRLRAGTEKRFGQRLGRPSSPAR